MDENYELEALDRSERRLTEIQQQAIEVLATGTSVSETARKIGVTRATVSRWVNHDVDFFTALNRLRSDMHESHGDRLRTLATQAFDVLEETLGPDMPPNLRYKAALAVIEAAKAIESEVGHTSREDLELESNLKKLPVLLSLH